MATYYFAEIDVESVRFTHSRIRPVFSGCGRKLEDTLAGLLSGEMDIKSLPVITVITTPGCDWFFSLGNRRLWVLKQLRSKGFFEKSKNLYRVRVKSALPKEQERYTEDRCSLTATLMREKGADCAEGEDVDEGEEEGGKDDKKDDDGNVQDTKDIEGSLKSVKIEVTESTNTDSITTTTTTTATVPDKTTSKKKKKVKPLSTEVTSQLKGLSKLMSKGKKGAQQVRSQVDELIESGVLEQEQEILVWDFINN